jgi:pSer/pThr/pTyr-binding forkhead associated (FHA) protein
VSIFISIKQNDQLIVDLPIPGKYIIGRSRQCDCKIDDDKVSSKHCSIECNNDGKIIFTDLDSSNGSYLKDKKIKIHKLEINDIITIGSTTISINKSKLSLLEVSMIGTAPKQVYINPTNEIVYEQEEKTGHTKLLKLK